MNKIYLAVYTSQTQWGGGLWIEHKAFKSKADAVAYCEERGSGEGWERVNPIKWRHTSDSTLEIEELDLN